MDFFQRQDDARRRTKILIVYFVLALVAIILAMYAVLFPVFRSMNRKHPSYGESMQLRESFIQWDWMLGTGACVLLVVFVGSGFKTMALSSGGAAVARSLDGRRVDPNTTDADERKLMNVVEEMSIASGVPVPEVYVLEGETSINAFAAGHTPSDAVVGVTRGCMKLLSRDELQGVIAHEFSHILNGDMKLNLRLVGLLFGILMLTVMGRGMLRIAYYSGRGSSREGKGGAALFLILAIALIVIGYVGVLFGNLIKSAVSRQREFLADASAVQFTRNPDGISGALRKIGGLQAGSRIENSHAEEASHMFFSNGMRAAMFSAFATHPPLKERIRAIDKNWDGSFQRVDLPEISSSWTDDTPATKQKAPPIFPAGAGIVGAVTAAAAVESIGRIDQKQIGYAHRIHSEFPEEWIHAVHNESGAQAIIFALLLAQDDTLRAGELEMLRAETDPTTYATTERLRSEIGDLHSSRKIALIDLAIPTLKRLGPEEYTRFSAIMHRLIEGDRQVDLFEFMLTKIVQRHLDIYFHRQPPPRIRYKSVSQLADEAAILLSTLAAIGGDDKAAIQKAFEAAAAELEMEVGGRLEMKSAAECGLDRIDEALNHFDQSSPIVKKSLLIACGKAAISDGKIVSGEAELLRAIADTIGCPIPPFVHEAA